MTTQMEQEAKQTPDCVASAFDANHDLFVEIAKRFHKTPPPFAQTIARGSSDHAASFAKYLFETQLKLTTASFAPSVETIYKVMPNVKNALTVAISQSGKSPDICESMQAARKAGSFTVAFVNVADSPLAEIAEMVVPLHAGPEKAVAATKSYITSLSNLIHFAAVISNDNHLLTACKQLPAQLEKALAFDWQTAVDILIPHSTLLVIGRGYGFPIACEAALKLKETAGIQAEAFSSAEVKHGPFALIKKNYPVFIFTQSDNTYQGNVALAEQLVDLGAKPIVATPVNQTLGRGIIKCETPEFLHPICDPLINIFQFYIMAAKLAVLRGYNPDSPDNLNKVTETL